MAFSCKPLLRKLGLAPFKWRWVLIAGCAAAAWINLRHHSPETAGTASIPVPKVTVATTSAPLTATTGGSGGTSVMMSGAAAKPVSSAAFGLSTINVIVHPNDTLDAIFRRLKLSLSDLASLRGLPGLKSRLDSLRPGESLRLMHRDGSLFGLERRLNE